MTRLLALFALTLAPVAAAETPPKEPQALFNDIHFHPTNYIQKGLTLQAFVDDIMGEVVPRSIVAPLPLQQKWDGFVSGDRAPDYYLRSDAALYYYSFADAVTAQQYAALDPEDRGRLDPMIVGFNPTDMYAADHIRRTVQTFPGVFTGIGEFSVHKEFVSSKIAGHTASLLNPALDGIFEVSAEIGLAVLIHCDINTVFSPNQEGDPTTAHYDDLVALMKRHPGARIIWAHTGLGRYVKPTDDHLALLGALLEDPELSHVSLDLSWDLVGSYVAANVEGWDTLVEAHPDRFLYGTDSVAPSSTEKYVANYAAYDALWAALSPEVREKVALTNYEALMDAARADVRAWEEAQGLTPAFVADSGKKRQRKRAR